MDGKIMDGGRKGRMDACSNSVDAKIDELTVLNCMDVFIASVDHCRKKRVLRSIQIPQSLSQGSPVKKTPAVCLCSTKQ